MKETGIRMSGNHPKLILDGLKTMTRRVVKDPRRPSRERDAMLSGAPGKYSMGDKARELELTKDTPPNFPCPYGQVGDRLWVRETWAVNPTMDFKPPRDIASVAFVYYKASSDGSPLLIGKWRPSIFMPRWASRITLEITEVRVERVQDISWRDCKREGVDPKKMPFSVFTEPWKDAFERLWDSLNAKRGFGWDTNPWVWVIGWTKYSPKNT